MFLRPEVWYHPGCELDPGSGLIDGLPRAGAEARLGYQAALEEQSMRRSLCGLIAVPLFVSMLWAAAGEPVSATAAQFKALVREYQEAQQAHYKAMREAKTDADRRKALSRKPAPRAFAERFVELAKKAPKDPAAFDALNWVLTYSANGPEADEATALITRDYLDSKRLGPVVQRLAASRSAAAEALLRAAAEKSPHREVQAQACYALASLLTAKARRPAAEEAGGDDGNEAKPKQPPREEAQALFERLATDYGDVKAVRKKTYGDLARAGLARLGSKPGKAEAPADGDPSSAGGVGLEVGMAAPAIEGYDTNGRPMRLSEYRGNVVVVDFWGHW